MAYWSPSPNLDSERSFFAITDVTKYSNWSLGLRVGRLHHLRQSKSKILFLWRKVILYVGRGEGYYCSRTWARCMWIVLCASPPPPLTIEPLWPAERLPSCLPSCQVTVARTRGRDSRPVLPIDGADSSPSILRWIWLKVASINNVGHQSITKGLGAEIKIYQIIPHLPHAGRAIPIAGHRYFVK